MKPTFYVTIEGSKQGKLKGESLAKSHKDKLEGYLFWYEVTSPRDTGTGQSSGRRQHKPVTFLKKWGAATPQIFQALFTNEQLTSVIFEFVQKSPSNEVYQTVKLTDAFVAGVKQYIGTAIQHGTRSTDSISKNSR